MSIQGAGAVPGCTIAGFHRRGLRGREDFRIVRLHYLSHVGHRAVGHFHIPSVEQLAVFSGNQAVDQAQELFCYVLTLALKGGLYHITLHFLLRFFLVCVAVSKWTRIFLYVWYVYGVWFP